MADKKAKSNSNNNWKKELQDAYRQSAKWAVKDSNKTFDKTISDTSMDALSRGMGRSSYTTQTLANLRTDKGEAGNRINSDFEFEYQKALRQRENEEEQRKLERERLEQEAKQEAERLKLEQQKLDEQRRQFDAQMAASAAASAGGGGGYSGGGRGGSTGSNTGGNTAGNGIGNAISGFWSWLTGGQQNTNQQNTNQPIQGVASTIVSKKQPSTTNNFRIDRLR